MEIYLLSNKNFHRVKIYFYQMKTFLSNANIFVIECKYIFYWMKTIFIEFCYIL